MSNKCGNFDTTGESCARYLFCTVILCEITKQIFPLHQISYVIFSITIAQL